MPKQEQLDAAKVVLKAKGKIEEIVGSPVGTVKVYSTPTDEEYEKEYEKMYEKKSKLLKNLKKFRPLGLLAGILVILGGVALLMLGIIFGLGENGIAIGVTLCLVVGICIMVFFFPKSWEPPSKEDYFDEILVENATSWLKEAEKNNYYFDLMKNAITEKKTFTTSISGARFLLFVGDKDFLIISRDNQLIVSTVTSQIENVTGITIQKKVQENSVSVNTEDKFYNEHAGKMFGNRFVTSTEVTRTTEYLISFNFSNRINPYSIYVGTDSNLLLSVVNLFEQITGIQARYI